MAKLIQSNFLRLWKSKSFWVCVILTLAFAILNAVLNFNSDDTSWMDETGSLIVDGISNSILFSAIFSALFLGTDYACGTIRNKLTVGHSRAGVYLSSLITVISGTLIITIMCAIPSILKAIVWGKNLGMTTDKFLLNIAIIVCAMIAVSAIFTLLGMLISEKSLITTFTIVLSVVMLIGSSILIQFLAQTENMPKYEFLDDGSVTVVGEEPNPVYIKPGIKRDIMTLIVDILPGGQLVNIESNEPDKPEIYPLYSFGVLTVTTAAGILIFRRKDLK